jgi:plastocyanin
MPGLVTATARPHRRRAVLAVLLVAATAALGACGDDDGGDSVTGPTTPPPDAVQVSTVTIQGMAFDPPSITIPVNNQVEWTNKDLTDPASASTGTPDTSAVATQHAVVSDDGTTFDSGPLDGLATFTYTFLEPGTYAYHCSIHPTMTGTVVVT